MSIKFNNVSYTYSPKTVFEYNALQNVSCDLENGKFIMIIGQTGSGKSTFLQLINALLLPTEGSIQVDDFNFDGQSKIKGIKMLRKHAGMVFQFSENQLFEETIAKDIAFGPKNFGATGDSLNKLVKDNLKLVGLDESYLDKSPFDLSGGQKRRVAIAGILAMEPDILLLDEPTAGLDPKGCFEMLELFKKINSKGTTIIMISHDMNHVLKYASDVLVFNEGNIVKYGSPLDVFMDDEILTKTAINRPHVLDFALSLKNNGFDINLSNVKDDESLFNEIKKGYRG